MTSARPERVSVPASTARALARGHAWVYREGRATPSAGTAVVIEHQGRPIGWGLADEGDVAVRVLGTEVPDRLDVAATIRERIVRADRLRERLLGGVTDAWRVVAGGGDGLPELVVDRYGPVAVVRLYARAWVPHLETIVRVVAGLPWCEVVGRRLGVGRVDGGEGFVDLHGDVPDTVIVSEHGARLLVRVRVGQKTGMFLDQREHRAIVGRLAAGREVANLFAYHGGFSVAAALGGAARVTTVDVAPEAIADAKENFRLNGLDPDDHAFVVADAFAWTARGKVDLLVVDPPSLARDKSAVAAAEGAYRRLHAHHGAQVARDGLLVSSSCTAWIGAEAWRRLVEEGLAESGAWSWLHQGEGTLDHPVPVGMPEVRYLKFGVLRRR